MPLHFQKLPKAPVLFQCLSRPNEASPSTFEVYHLRLLPQECASQPLVPTSAGNSVELRDTISVPTSQYPALRFISSQTKKRESRDPQGNGANTSEPGITPKLKHLQAWASTVSLEATSKMGGVTMQAGSAAGSLRRIASDSHVLERARLHRADHQPTQLKVRCVSVVFAGKV